MRSEFNKDTASTFSSFGRYSNIRRFENTLLLQGTSQHDEINPPIIDGINNLVLSGAAGNDAYRISDDVWQHYQKIIIDNWDPSQSLDRIVFNFSNKKLFSLKVDNDLVIRDTTNNKELILRNYFNGNMQAGSHSDYQHIIFSNS